MQRSLTYISNYFLNGFLRFKILNTKSKEEFTGILKLLQKISCKIIVNLISFILLEICHDLFVIYLLLRYGLCILIVNVYTNQ